MNGRRRAGVALGDVAKFCPKTRQRFCLTPRTLPVLRIDSVGLSLTRGSDHHRITPRKPASVCLCAPQPPLGSVTRDAGGVTSTTARNLAPGEPAGSDAGFLCRMAVAERGFHRAGRAGECVAGGKNCLARAGSPSGQVRGLRPGGYRPPPKMGMPELLRSRREFAGRRGLSNGSQTTTWVRMDKRLCRKRGCGIGTARGLEG